VKNVENTSKSLSQRCVGEDIPAFTCRQLLTVCASVKDTIKMKVISSNFFILKKPEMNPADV
jgi:hypothetical protein